MTSERRKKQMREYSRARRAAAKAAKSTALSTVVTAEEERTRILEGAHDVRLKLFGELTAHCDGDPEAAATLLKLGLVPQSFKDALDAVERVEAKGEQLVALPSYKADQLLKLTKQ